MTTNDDGTPLPKKTRTNEPPRLWYMRYLYAREAPPTSGLTTCESPGCKEPNSTKTVYQCEECFGGKLYCRTCTNQIHATQPFHRIRSWTPGPGAHFVRASAYDRGFVLRLGHDGDPCPLGMSVQEMHIMHTNGIHIMPVSFCRCSGRLDWQQALDHDLFPGTEDRIRSIFTFAVLDLFHSFNLISKTAPRDFNRALMRLTDAGFPKDVPVCFLTHYFTLATELILTSRTCTNDLVLSYGNGDTSRCSSAQVFGVWQKLGQAKLLSGVRPVRDLALICHKIGRPDLTSEFALTLSGPSERAQWLIPKKN